MQKALSEFVSLSAADIRRLTQAGPLLITNQDEPQFVAQSLESFEEMVRRLRALESKRSRPPRQLGKVIQLRP